jgi:hypothetical protein
VQLPPGIQDVVRITGDTLSNLDISMYLPRLRLIWLDLGEREYAKITSLRRRVDLLLQVAAGAVLLAMGAPAALASRITGA